MQACYDTTMQMILAPSKTMDMTKQLSYGLVTSDPRFLSQAETLAAHLKKREDIEKFMSISPTLAEKVAAMYRHWGEESAPAIYAYVGDVYKGFHADTLSKDDLLWANDHVIIMSGLYGVVRPFDIVSPYRLEMKARLSVGTQKDLYEFWDEKLAKYVDSSAGGVICNLASDEYGRPVTRHAKSRIVTPVFLDKKGNGKIGTVPIYSKMMRGVMARWIIDHRLDDPGQLKEFTGQGYAYDAAHSTDDQPAFFRPVPKPVVYR